MEDEARKDIQLNDSVRDVMVIMAEGNPGGLTVLMNMMKASDLGTILMMHLDDMNIRGSQIWIGYKAYCGEDMPKFINAIIKRDPQMVEVINKQGEMGSHRHLAVTGQASEPGNRRFIRKREPA